MVSDLDTWLNSKAWNLGRQLALRPPAPPPQGNEWQMEPDLGVMADGSQWVADYVDAAAWAYKGKGGGAEELSYWPSRVRTEAESAGMCYAGQPPKGGCISTTDYNTVVGRLQELAQRGMTKTPTGMTAAMLSAARQPVATAKAVPVYQGMVLPTVPKVPVLPSVPAVGPSPMPGAAVDPAAACASQGGVWDPVALVCGPAPPVITGQTPEEACVASGGTWDQGTTSCIPPGGGQPLVAQTMALDYPRVHREALGYGYWALDIPPEAEPAALAALQGLRVQVAPGPVQGLAWVAMRATVPPNEASQSAADWIAGARAGGNAVLGTIIDDAPMMVALRDVSVASQLTTTNDKAAVLFEPSGGWTAPSKAGKTALYVALGVGGAAAIGGLVYYGMKKPKLAKNPRRGRRRRRR